MNTQDFERLKAFCEKDAIDFCDFLEKTIKNAMANFLQEKLDFLEKKDPWDGVEFAECIDFEHSAGKTNGLLTFGKIYRVSNIVNGSEDCHIINDENYEGNCYLCILKPSTEAAYIDQLKKDALERFGEIKEGDRFDQGIFGYSIETINYQPWNGYEKGFDYKATSDSLYFDNLLIYQSGKWANKVKERVEVFPTSMAQDFNGTNFTFDFQFDQKRNVDIIEASEYLAKCLKEYLNKE